MTSRAPAIRTRFAPSPTGLLHIGGARTALFNYLFSRHHGGEFLIRVEDTDQARSRPEFVDAMLDSLAWLGMAPDAPPLFQSTRAARHAEVAHSMLASGHAYRCWLTAADLAAMRDAAKAQGKHFRLDSPWRDRDPAEAPPGQPAAIRLRAPRDGDTVVHDLVQGEVRVANAELDDMILLRSDGTPTYQHAVVVDDHDMEISHVIRGDDHLTNTFRQVQIFHAMGWDVPAFAHVPMIHGADGAKLSKRHGAQSVTEFRDAGLLPEALCNYLLRLGWGHGDEEVISPDRAIALFDLDGVGRSPSRMDYVRLTQLNGVWIRAAGDDRLTGETMQRLGDNDPAIRARVRALMPVLKERAKTLVELAASAAFLALPIPLPLTAKAAAVLTPDNRTLLGEIGAALDATAFTPDAIDATLRAYAAASGRKLGDVAQPLRVALTGSTVSPGIDAVLMALGKDAAGARIRAMAG